MPPSGGRSVAAALDRHSSSALLQAVHTLESLGDVQVATHEGTYEDGLVGFAHQRPAQQRALVLFLGSNIGNFDRPGRETFLRAVRRALRPGDRVLLGVDLVKPERELLLAIRTRCRRRLTRCISMRASEGFAVDAHEQIQVERCGDVGPCRRSIESSRRIRSRQVTQ